MLHIFTSSIRRAAAVELLCKKLHCSGLIYDRSRVLGRSMASTGSTAGIIIIGDEIIKGKVSVEKAFVNVNLFVPLLDEIRESSSSSFTPPCSKVADTNSTFLARKLYSLGVDVRRISIIPDVEADIAEEVAKFSSQFTHVVTAGGIGPTHDDVTYQAVARGLGEQLILHPELVSLIRAHFKIDVGDFDPSTPPVYPTNVDTSSFNPALKMALVPACSRLHSTQGAFPMIQARNIFILPGVPKYLEMSAKHLETLCRNPDRTYHSRAIYLTADEVRLAPCLNDAVRQHGADVVFGSYPVLGLVPFLLFLFILKTKCRKSRGIQLETGKRDFFLISFLISMRKFEINQVESIVTGVVSCF